MAASLFALRGGRQLALRSRVRVPTIARASLSPLNTRRALHTSQPETRRGVYTSSITDHGDPHPQDIFQPLDTFPRRHIGPSPDAAAQMLAVLDPPVASLDDFVKQVLPEDILSKKDLKLSLIHI